jgi:hypothetical protein
MKSWERQLYPSFCLTWWQLVHTLLLQRSWIWSILQRRWLSWLSLLLSIIARCGEWMGFYKKDPPSLTFGQEGIPWCVHQVRERKSSSSSDATVRARRFLRWCRKYMQAYITVAKEASKIDTMAPFKWIDMLVPSCFKVTTNSDKKQQHKKPADPGPTKQTPFECCLSATGSKVSCH